MTVPAEPFHRQQGACGTEQLQIGEAVGLEALTSGRSECTARAEGDALFLALDGATLRSALRWVTPGCSAALPRLRGSFNCGAECCLLRSALQVLYATDCYRSIVWTRHRGSANSGSTATFYWPQGTQQICPLHCAVHSTAAAAGDAQCISPHHAAAWQAIPLSCGLQSHPGASHQAARQRAATPPAAAGGPPHPKSHRGSAAVFCAGLLPLLSDP